MNIKDIYNPDKEDLLNWINGNGDSNSWPDGEWDVYVTAGGDNDDTILEYANKENSKQLFFIHCLFYLAGEYFIYNRNIHNKIDSELTNQRKERLDKLLSQVNSESNPEVQQWKEEVTQVLLGEKDSNDRDWFGYLFKDYSDDL